jgi:3-dehydroquinate synthetase
VIKATIAITPERVGELEAVLREDARYPLGELAWIGGLCVEAKQLVMRHDPGEKAEAYVLHSGHEIGYQAELAHGIPHGLAISVGCLVSHRAAELAAGLDPSVRELHAALLRKAGISTAFPAGASPEKLVRGLYRGGARGIIDPRPRYVDLVLLKGLGVPDLTYVPRLGRSVPLTQVHEDIAVQAVRDIQAAA